ncbi:hypothetical protein ABT288_23335 [Streptomyces sp. NPDC001093]|uniref:hypothetical protein n=1 Tax=Streptomyces sp. NPDC001093 TaxID=3154376 RepID=UPI003316D0B9
MAALAVAGRARGRLVAGAAEWVVEAYLSHDGPAQRLAEGSSIQGGLGWNLAVDDQLRSLVGRTLCYWYRWAAPPRPPSRTCS